jgi:hypothetical protein
VQADHRGIPALQNGDLIVIGLGLTAAEFARVGDRSLTSANCAD